MRWKAEVRKGEGGIVHGLTGKEIFVFPENKSPRNSTKGRLVFLALDRIRKGLLHFAWRQHANNVKHTVNMSPCFHRGKSQFGQVERESELCHSAFKLLCVCLCLSHEGMVYMVLLPKWPETQHKPRQQLSMATSPSSSQILGLISEVMSQIMSLWKRCRIHLFYLLETWHFLWIFLPPELTVLYRYCDNKINHQNENK